MSEFPFNLKSNKSGDGGIQEESNRKPPRFLNYTPLNQALKGQEVNTIADISVIEKTAQIRIKSSIEQFLNEEKGTINIIPKKPNIDLKRHLQPKLEKLNKRTQLAIIELLREKFGLSKKEGEIKTEEEDNKFQGSVEAFGYGEKNAPLPFERTIEALKNFRINEVREDEDDFGINKVVDLIPDEQEERAGNNLPDLVEGLKIREKAFNDKDSDGSDDDE